MNVFLIQNLVKSSVLFSNNYFYLKDGIPFVGRYKINSTNLELFFEKTEDENFCSSPLEFSITSKMGEKVEFGDVKSLDLFLVEYEDQLYVRIDNKLFYFDHEDGLMSFGKFNEKLFNKYPVYRATIESIGYRV
jgi:hypothetical protein